MSKPRTYVAIILDKSGSMGCTKETAITGFNELVQQLKEDAKTQEIFCSLVTFNGEVFEHLWNVPADQLAEANADNYLPNGSTAMRDAIGYTVQKLINTTDYENPDNAYLVKTVSDGETNADSHFSVSALKELLESCQSKQSDGSPSRWTFTYMGCTESYLKEISRQTGTPMSNMASWSNTTDRGTENAFKSAKNRQAKYFAARMKGEAVATNYASDGITCADYSAEPSLDTQIEVAVMTAAISNPVIEENSVAASITTEPLQAKKLSEVIDKMPKFVDKAAVTWTGDGNKMFTASNRVEWKN